MANAPDLGGRCWRLAWAFHLAQDLCRYLPTLAYELVQAAILLVSRPAMEGAHDTIGCDQGPA